MFAILFALQIDNMDLARTLHSFHLIRAAVHKEECDGYRRSVSVIVC
jgi:negative regulator of sigma E activity